MKIIERKCPFCGKTSIVEVDENQFNEWVCGLPAQDAFPLLPASKREILISGICETCQEEIF